MKKVQWETIDLINKKLKEELLYLPFCYNINGKYIQELKQVIENNGKIGECIIQRISLPEQRAYQMEYRYKHISIFKPFLTLLEYATYDFLSGNLICAYLSMIPIVEAILRKWAEEVPNLSFGKISKKIPEFLIYWKAENNNKTTNNERLKKCFEYEIEYVRYVLNLFYENFDQYADHNFSDIFNRNLSLHKLEGISNQKEIKYNLNRLYLLIDTIADLYTISKYDEYFKLSFYADSNNKDFQIRWKYYKLICKQRNNINLIEYCLNSKINENEKDTMISVLDLKIESINIIEKMTYYKDEHRR